MIGDLLTINARKFDGRIRRSWIGAVTAEHDDLITVIAEFSETHQHNDLGTIQAGTISIEHFWTDRWYNVFHFREPDGSPKAIYSNIAMPATIDNGVIDYIDLDIDVILWPDARIEVLDMDDFERNSATYGYPTHVRKAAEDALQEVLALANKREFPFN